MGLVKQHQTARRGSENEGSERENLFHARTTMAQKNLLFAVSLGQGYERCRSLLLPGVHVSELWKDGNDEFLDLVKRIPIVPAQVIQKGSKSFGASTQKFCC